MIESISTESTRTWFIMMINHLSPDALVFFSWREGFYQKVIHRTEMSSSDKILSRCTLKVFTSSSNKSTIGPGDGCRYRKLSDRHIS